MILFPIAEPFSKGKQTLIWQSEKRSTLWPEKEFFKSNMDALTVLSIWDTDKEERSVLILFFCLVELSFFYCLQSGQLRKTLPYMDGNLV